MIQLHKILNDAGKDAETILFCLHKMKQSVSIHSRKSVLCIASIRLLILLTALFNAGASTIVTYPNPPLTNSTEFTVTANGSSIYVFNAGDFRTATFSMDSNVTIAVTYNGTITNFTISPISKGITAVQSGTNVLTFTLPSPMQVEVNINGATRDMTKLLYIFADPFEVNPPAPSNTNVIYYAAGAHNIGYVTIDGSTDKHTMMYLAPGAMVTGYLTITGTTNFTVCGRGLFQAGTDRSTLITIKHSINTTLKDILLFNATYFDMDLYGDSAHDSCHGILIDNVKSVHTGPNTDAFHFYGMIHDVTINNCFVYSADNLLLYGADTIAGPYNTTVQNCTFGKPDEAGNWCFPQGLMGGSAGGVIGSNNVVTNCDIIRMNGEVALVAENYGQPYGITNMVFQNIRVQPTPGNDFVGLVNLQATNQVGDKNLIFQDIYLPAAGVSVVSNGNWNLVFDHVYVNGVVATQDSDLNLTKGDGVTTTYLYSDLVSQGMTATADSTLGTNAPSNGNDGNFSGTYWCAADAGTNHWWKVDLGASTKITQCCVNWQYATNYKWMVEVSEDNINWTMALDERGTSSTSQKQNYYVSSVVGRFVRITVTGLPAGCSACFYEFQVWGFADNEFKPLPVVLTGARMYDGTTNVAAGILTILNNLDGSNLGLAGSCYVTNKNVGVQPLFLTQMSPARVNVATGYLPEGGTQPWSITVPAPADGNTLVAVLSAHASVASPAATAITQTGATWTRAAYSKNPGGTVTEIWYAPNVYNPGTNVAISLNWRSAAVIAEYRGLAPVNPVDVSASNTNISGTADTGTTANTSQNNELWFGGIGLADSSYNLMAPNNGFSVIGSSQSVSTSSGSNAKVYALDKLVTATGPANVSATVSGPIAWSGVMVAFKVAQVATSLTLTGSAADKYTLDGMTGFVTITNALLTVSGIIASNKVYDGTTLAKLNTNNVNWTGNLDGTNVLLNLAGAIGNFLPDGSVGTNKTVQIFGLTVSGSATNNYLLLQPTTTANIAAFKVTLTSNGNPTTLSATGTPGNSYITQRSTNLVNWVNLSTNIAPTPSGVITITDSYGDLGGHQPRCSFYRLEH